MMIQNFKLKKKEQTIVIIDVIIEMINKLINYIILLNNFVLVLLFLEQK
jgi:hypothetical protein